MSQVAKLFIRGRGNYILKNLNESQKEDLNITIDNIIDDPLLQHCKHEFCGALGRTIKNEYCDKDIGLQDYRVAIMRAVVAAKYDKLSKATPETLIDPIQRKKWCQTYAFNYLKQILRENKIAGYSKSTPTYIQADDSAIDEIKKMLEEMIRYEENNINRMMMRKSLTEMKITRNWSTTIQFNQMAFPITLVYKIADIAMAYKKYKLSIMLHTDSITIDPVSDHIPYIEVFQKKEIHINAVAFDVDEENDNRDQLEYDASKGKKMQPDFFKSETLKELQARIPDDAKDVLSVILEPPHDYVEKYGSRVRKAYLAKYLNKNPREIGKILEDIKYHCMALGIKGFEN